MKFYTLSVFSPIGPISQWSSVRGNFASQGPLAIAGDIFDCHDLVGVVASIQQTGAGDAVKRHSWNGTALTTNNYLVPNVNKSEFQKLFYICLTFPVLMFTFIKCHFILNLCFAS